MTANYPLRWDPVPASCHGDIARASVNAGAAAGNHPDPELTGKTVRTTHLRPTPHHKTLNLLLLKGPLYISQTPPPAPGTFSLSLSEHSPSLTDEREIVNSCVMFRVLT